MNSGNRKIGLRGAANTRLGRELFAREYIKKGEVALQLDGIVVENGSIARIPDSLFRWCYDFDDTHTFCPVDSQYPSIDWWLNHSCEPSIGSSGEPFRRVAMRDISAGEAIVIDYAMIDSAPRGVDDGMFLWRIELPQSHYHQ